VMASSFFSCPLEFHFAPKFRSSRRSRYLQAPLHLASLHGAQQK
jgi:hypothetical protein